MTWSIGACTEGMSLEALEAIVLDVTHRDVKQRSMLDQPEVGEALFGSLLANKRLLDRLRSRQTRLVFF